MPRKRRKSYIRPRTSHTSIYSSSDNLITDTTGEERFKVFEVCTRMRKYTAALLITSASLSTFMLLLQFFTNTQMFLISQLKPFTIIATSFIGITNLVCGLLLLATE
ncbi:MAG: hypothetical protein QXF53_02350, partial [Candidatus Bathyarchaeia archaeon]